jgi:hypothetical protein
MHFIFPANSCSSAFRANRLSPKISRLSKMSFSETRFGHGTISPHPPAESAAPAGAYSPSQSMSVQVFVFSQSLMNSYPFFYHIVDVNNMIESLRPTRAFLTRSSCRIILLMLLLAPFCRLCRVYVGFDCLRPECRVCRVYVGF